MMEGFVKESVRSGIPDSLQLTSISPDTSQLTMSPLVSIEQSISSTTSRYISLLVYLTPFFRHQMLPKTDPNHRMLTLDRTSNKTLEVESSL